MRGGKNVALIFQMTIILRQTKGANGTIILRRREYLLSNLFKYIMCTHTHTHVYTHETTRVYKLSKKKI